MQRCNDTCVHLFYQYSCSSSQSDVTFPHVQNDCVILKRFRFQKDLQKIMEHAWRASDQLRRTGEQTSHPGGIRCPDKRSKESTATYNHSIFAIKTLPLAVLIGAPHSKSSTPSTIPKAGVGSQDFRTGPPPLLPAIF